MTREKNMLCAVWNKINSMQTDVSTVEIWIPKDVETSEGETGTNWGARPGHSITVEKWKWKNTGHSTTLGKWNWKNTRL